MKKKLALSALLPLVLIIAACGGPAVPATQPTPTSVPFENLDLPEIIMPEGQQFAEFELTLEELAAEESGSMPYAGRRCVLSPAGCACEQDLVETISFSFPTNSQMIRTFAGPGYNSSWEMVRVGENQWSYSALPVVFEDDTQLVAMQFAYLTFTPNGYILNEGADFQSAIVTCPDVQFTRAAFDHVAFVEAFFARAEAALGATPAETAAAIAAAESAEPYLTEDFLAAIEANAAAPAAPDPLFCNVTAPSGIDTVLLSFSDVSARVAVSLGDPANAYTVLLTSPDNGATWRISGTDCATSTE